MPRQQLADTSAVFDKIVGCDSVCVAYCLRGEACSCKREDRRVVLGRRLIDVVGLIEHVRGNQCTWIDADDDDKIERFALT